MVPYLSYTSNAPEDDLGDVLGLYLYIHIYAIYIWIYIHREISLSSDTGPSKAQAAALTPGSEASSSRRCAVRASSPASH